VAVRLVPPPSGGLFRVGRPERPFNWEVRQEPLPDSDRPVLNGRRWDDPDGEYPTLYCGTDRQTVFAETIAQFRLRPGLRDRILRETDEDAPDPDYDFDEPEGRVPPDYFGRALGHVLVEEETRFIDVDDVETHNELNASFGELLVELGTASQYDRGMMLGQDRRLTRRVAGFLHEHYGDQAVGIRYESRLDSAFECWALWPQARVVMYEEDVEPISVETAELVEVAARLGLTLPTLEEMPQGK